MPNSFDNSVIIDTNPTAPSGGARFGFGRAPNATNVLGYDGQSVNFAVGDTVVGATSGATGVVVEDYDLGTSGYLYLTTVTGVFLDNENLLVSSGVRAVCNGTLQAYAEGDGTRMAFIVGSNAPTVFAPPGSIYFRVDTGKAYMCNGIQAGVITWGIVTSA